MEKTCDRISNSQPETDRISELPDAILHLILYLLPFKSAVKTSILSKRWRKLYEHVWIHSNTLDFGVEFAKGQTKLQFVNTVNRYLLLHRSNRIKKFQLFFYPGTKYQPDAEKWIDFAALKSVKELDVNFCGRPRISISSDDDDDSKDNTEESLRLPCFLYSCDSLTHLKLWHCDFNPPLDFTGFGFLVSLSLISVTISDGVLESILYKCGLLRNLTLWECENLNSIKILGPKNLQLMSLLVGSCCDASEIDILAPNLKSFHFCCDLLCRFSFQNVTALDDVYISSHGYECTEPEHDYIHILSSISHIMILTTCTGPLMYVTLSEEYNPEALPITFPYLQELQILLPATITEEFLHYTYGFFNHTVWPCVERIFIELLDPPYDPSRSHYHDIIGLAEEPTNCCFYNLKTIKINNFCGSAAEIKLVSFFLTRAVSLEFLVLVAAQNSGLKNAIESLKDSASTSQSSKSLEIPSIAVHDQLLNLPKASNDARILLCEQGEVDTSLYPTHTEYYCQLCCLECTF